MISHDNAPVAAVVPMSWSAGMAPTLLKSTPLGLDVASVPAPFGQAPVGLQGSASTFSAVHQSVFLAGGTINRSPTRALFRYNLVENAWNSLPVQPAANGPAAVVFGATMDARHGRVYVLDQELVDRTQMVRLLSINAITGEGQVMSSWPYAGTHSSLSIGMTAGGELILVAVGDGRYDAFRFGISEGQLITRGGYTASGRVVDSTFMGPKDVSLPVWRSSHLVFDNLSAGPFDTRMQCGSL